MTDEQVEQECVRLTELIGPTRAGWWREAVDLGTPDNPSVSHQEIVWLCRIRELVYEVARLEADTEQLRQAELDSARERGDLRELLFECRVYVVCFRNASGLIDRIDAALNL